MSTRMPKLARRAGLMAVALAVCLPAPALAADLVVDQGDANNACARTGDTTCKTIGQAIAASQSKDTITIRPGSYAESVTIPASKDELDIKGSGPGDTGITGNGTGDVVDVAGDGVKISELTIDVPANAGSALRLAGTGGQVTRLIAQRLNASNVNDPTIDVAGAATLAGVNAVQNAGAGTATVSSSGAGGVVISDCVLVSGTGPAIALSSSNKNAVIRTFAAAVKPDADGLLFISPGASVAAKKLTVDSTVLVGGATGAGLRAVTEPNTAPVGTSGDIDLDLRHLTVVGSAQGIVLDASRAPLVPGSPPPGGINATVAASIVKGASEARAFAGGAAPLSSPNRVNMNFARSDASPANAVGGAKVDMGGAANSPQAALFPAGRATLRADAPVVDKGGPLIDGESTKDIEGEERLFGAATDIGADEFNNEMPSAAFGVTKARVRQEERVGFISGSSDPETAIGGGIAEYRWDFGDGKTETTRVPAVVHSYAEKGTFQAKLTVVDRQGGASEAPAAAVTVSDGLPPAVAILSPTNNARLRLRGRSLRVRGLVVDEAGVRRVEVSVIRLIGSGRRRRCRQLQATRLGPKKTCSSRSRKFLRATIKGRRFSFKSKQGIRLPKGRYELRVRGVDRNNIRGRSYSINSRTLVRFRVR